LKPPGLAVEPTRISLSRTADLTLRWFWLHISTFQQQETTRVTQLHLIAKCFARNRFRVSDAFVSPANCEQKLTGETKKTNSKYFSVVSYSRTVAYCGLSDIFCFRNRHEKINHPMFIPFLREAK